jgi:hypothetical protein
MTSIASTVEQVHRVCTAGAVPVNVALPVAIEAHQLWPTVMTLRTIIMARVSGPTEDRQKLDCLADLPEAAWGDLVHHRERTLNALRRSIAWNSICI